MSVLHPDTLNFLALIKENNSRHFFWIMKPLYEQVRDKLVDFAIELVNEVKKFDDSLSDTMQAKQCLFRIYRDARRLKEGDPVYKTNFWLHLAPNGKNDTRAWYYLHIQPWESFFGGWVYRPTSEELLNLRHYLLKHGDEYLTLTTNKEFVRQFGQIQGTVLQKTPRWFPKEHKYLGLIMRKQHLIYHKYTDAEIVDENFMELFVSHCKLAKDRFHFLNKGYAYNAWKSDEL